ncbi:unnamed protein product [Closterium sp. NIES-53]
MFHIKHARRIIRLSFASFRVPFLHRSVKRLSARAMAKIHADCSPLVETKWVCLCVRLRLFTLFELLLVSSLLGLLVFARLPLPCTNKPPPLDDHTAAPAGPSQPAPSVSQESAPPSTPPSAPQRHPEDDPSQHLRRFVSPDFYRPRLAPWGRSSATTGNTKAAQPPPSGICIAIPSAPRFDPDGEEKSWQRVENLLLALDARRARERDGLLERAMRVVVYSSGCRVDDPARRAGAAKIGGPGGASPSALMRAAAVLAREANVSETYARPLVGALAQDVANVNPLVDAHTAAIQAVAERMELPVDVLPAHPDGCALLGDAGRLLRSAPREHVERDGWQRWRWHTKLSMDFAYAVRQCLATRPRYVLLLQDDAFPARLWDVGIERFMARDLRGKAPWDVLSLYYPRSYRWNLQHAQEYDIPCCAQSLLFSARSAAEAVAHVERGVTRAPMDLLLHEFIGGAGEDGRQRRAYVHVPSLFQHTGRVRSTGQGREKASFHEDVQFPDERGVDAPYSAEEKLALLRGKAGERRAEGAYGQVEPDGWHEFLERQQQELAQQMAAAVHGGGGSGGGDVVGARRSENELGGGAASGEEARSSGERRGAGGGKEEAGVELSSVQQVPWEGESAERVGLRPKLRAGVSGNVLRRHFLMKDMVLAPAVADTIMAPALGHADRAMLQR